MLLTIIFRENQIKKGYHNSLFNFPMENVTGLSGYFQSYTKGREIFLMRLIVLYLIDYLIREFL